MERFRALTREHAEVSRSPALYERFRQREADLAQAQEMLDDPEMAEMAREEIAAIEAELPELEDELQRMLLPKDPDDARNTFIEIRAGTAATSRRCSPATCCACTPATPSARAGAPRS